MTPRSSVTRRILRAPALGTLLGRLSLLALLLAAGGAWTAAQEKPDPVPGQKAPTYDSKGRRDPFISLRALQQEKKGDLLEPPPLAQRPPGLPGLLIDEITVVGIVAGIDEPIALLRGIDDFTYFAKGRDKLFDGHVIEVNGERVIFQRIRRDARGNVYRSKVIKRLNSQEIQVVEEEGGNPDEEL
ncbi:MAG TPA: hypothetical protein VLV83_09665 [Acidobacteriota bacterium]|nr:hypothetical protein [Acidobacteriota bacterium]